MFLIMLTGFLCIHFNVLHQETPHFLINFIFNVAAPALIFIGMATAPLSQIFHWDFIFATIISIAICLFTWIFFIKKLYPNKIYWVRRIDCLLRLSGQFSIYWTAYIGAGLRAVKG